MKKSLVSIFCTIALILCSCSKNNDDSKTLLHKDDFDGDLSAFSVEQMPGGTAVIKNGKLEIDDKDGCTIWFKEKMTGNIQIEYDVVMIDSGGVNDRVSDLNCFWKAIDPENPDDIFANAENRTGRFNNYHYFRLYYVGYGANDNTSTRFRRYPGDGTRPLLPEHDLTDSIYMNIPNVKRHLKIQCIENQIRYQVDDLLIYDFNDEEPYEEGWFGFRTVNNHMTIDNFRVYSLKE